MKQLDVGGCSWTMGIVFLFTGLVSLAAVAAACVAPTQQQQSGQAYGGQGQMGQGQMAASAPSAVAGVYRAQVGPEVHEIVLHPDGSGTFDGQPGGWQLQNGQLLLSDGQMLVQASLAGEQLTLHTPQGDMSFARQGGPQPAGPQPWGGAGGQQAAQAPFGPVQGAEQAGSTSWGGAASASQGAAKPFSPTDTLSGDVVVPEGSGAEFTVPDGWKHGFVRAPSGTEVYALARKTGVGEILIERRLLSAANNHQMPSALLGEAIQAQYGNMAVTQALPLENIDVAGQPSARAILRGEANGQAIENYLAGVVAHGYAFVLIGIYPASDADAGRRAFDTVLSTFRASVPRENTALRDRLVGCWNSSSGSTDSNSYDSSRRKLLLQADGSYSYRSSLHISASGGGSASSSSAEQGRFRVERNTVVTMSDKGEAGSYEVAFRGGILLLNGRKYLSCGR